jgi:hypothetical protein
MIQYYRSAKVTFPSGMVLSGYLATAHADVRIEHWKTQKSPYRPLNATVRLFQRR